MKGIWWTCCRCGNPIDGDPHQDPAPPDGTDGDACPDCCSWCNDPEAAARARPVPLPAPLFSGGEP